jgi:hypothetical protein
VTQRGLTRTQVQRLLRGIDPAHVESKRGLAYMAQHEVRAELTRIFGVGNWDSEVTSMDRMWEDTYEKDGKTYYRVCYRAGVRLTIRDYWGNFVCSFVEYHAEANSGLPDRGEAEAMAITSVESYALRRAALGLGDRLGLGLYNDGKQVPLVKGSLQLTDKESPLYIEPEKKEGEPGKESFSGSKERLQAVVNDRTADASR